MNDRSLAIERLRRAFAAPNDDVPRVVDELLAVASAHRMKIDWSDGACEISELGADMSGERFPMAKSVFQAILARIAALYIPDSMSVTAYAGAGEIDAGREHRISAAYFNEADRQWLCLGPVVSPSRASLGGPAAPKIAAT